MSPAWRVDLYTGLSLSVTRINKPNPPLGGKVAPSRAKPLSHRTQSWKVGPACQ